MISIKTAREVSLMRKAGEIVGKVFDGLKPLCVPGVSTQELADKAEEIIRSNGATPTFLNYCGFKGAICVSVNEVLIHGIPSKSIILKNGDIVSLDVGATYQGYCGDACRTYEVGIVKDEAKKLIKVGEESFYKAISLIKPGVHLGDICAAIEEYVKSYGYSVPREYTGHGIGSHLHEDPAIPNYGKAGTGVKLIEGMTLAIEPMVLMGSNKIRISKDNWTVRSKDGKISTHYENTVVVTHDGCEILTLSESEKGDKRN